MDKQLLGRVERLRGQMNLAFKMTQNPLHRDVLQLSQTLDELIVQVQIAKWSASKRKK